MSAVELTLAAAAFVIGITGAWSPCGFSMVETIGLAGDPGRRRTTFAACATFAPGAVAGGAITFGALAGLGGLAHGAGGRTAYLIAAAIAGLAALLEARGARIVPQIRRQLPERWRRTMPMPLAAGLYGVLLGLGFTTFVLTFGVWALAGIAFALGHAGAGLAIGVAFGLGRALPVVALAPVVDRPLGIRCTELMAERPALYRGFRLGDAAALVLAAVVLVVSTGERATAAHLVVARASDPSVAGGTLVFERPDGRGGIQRGGERKRLPGTDPAVGGGYVAVIKGGQTIALLDRKTLAPVSSVVAKGGPDAVAVSDDWLVYRVTAGGGDVLKARRIVTGGQIRDAHKVGTASRPSQLGQPDLDGGKLVFARNQRASSRIKLVRLGHGRTRAVAVSRGAQLTNASIEGRSVLFVRGRRLRHSPQSTRPERMIQELVLKHLGGGARTIYSRGKAGLIWSTALSGHRAYFTLLKGGARILRVSR